MSAPAEKIDDQTRLAVLEVARDRYAMGSDDDIEIDDNADVHHNGAGQTSTRYAQPFGVSIMKRKKKTEPAPVDKAPALWDHLTTLIQEYADAQEVDSWKGGGDPDYVEVKEAMLVLARAKLNAYISELRGYYHGDE